MDIFTQINVYGGECFVIPNSKEIGIREDHAPETRARKVARHDAIKWLKKTKTEYQIWWSDWDTSGGRTHVYIKAPDRRALFKLQFVTGPTIDYRKD